MTGKYSGLAPAMTAFTATCSTVYSHATRNLTGCRWPTIPSAAWLVCASISATRFSVGRTIGSLSVQLLSRNSRCRFSSVSGASVRGVVVSYADRSRADMSRTGMGGVERHRERLDDFLHHRTAGNGILAVHVGFQLVRRLAHDRLRHEGARRLRQAGHLGHGRHDAVELVGVQRHSRHPVFGLERDGVGGDRGRAIAAMTDPDNGG